MEVPHRLKYQVEQSELFVPYLEFLGLIMMHTGQDMT